jgi:hypothetical protein
VRQPAELQALEFEEERVEYEEVEQTTPEGTALMAQWRALQAACEALSPVGRYHVASVSYRKCDASSLLPGHCPRLSEELEVQRQAQANTTLRKSGANSDLTACRKSSNRVRLSMALLELHEDDRGFMQ